MDARLQKRTVKGQVQYCVPTALWKCPRCGIGGDTCGTDKGEFIHEGNIDDFVSNAEAQISESDYEAGWTEDGSVFCSSCKYSASMRTYFSLLLKQQDLVPCPCCKGEGTVSSKKAKEWSK